MANNQVEHNVKGVIPGLNEEKIGNQLLLRLIRIVFDRIFYKDSRPFFLKILFKSRI